MANAAWRLPASTLNRSTPLVAARLTSRHSVFSCAQIPCVHGSAQLPSAAPRPVLRLHAGPSTGHVRRHATSSTVHRNSRKWSTRKVLRSWPSITPATQLEKACDSFCASARVQRVTSSADTRHGTQRAPAPRYKTVPVCSYATQLSPTAPRHPLPSADPRQLLAHRNGKQGPTCARSVRCPLKLPAGH